MNTTFQTHLADEAATLRFAASIANATQGGMIIYLYGSLGAGKTTLTRGILRALGYAAKVKSPTYTLVEPYEINGRHIYHCDFYRLDEPAAIEHLGIREYLTDDAICVMEWPEKGEGWLPVPDLACYIEMVGEGRDIKLEAHSERGSQLVGKLVCEAGKLKD